MSEASRSMRGFFIELVTITAGVLIALTFDSVADWRHQRALVAEARANITTELRDNKKELERILQTLPATGEQLRRMLALTSDLRAQRTPTVTSLELTYNLAQLGVASRATAEATGAFGFMPYADVKRYAEVYDLQQQFIRLQERVLDLVGPILSATKTPFEELTTAEIEDWRRQIRLAMSNLQVESSLGVGLGQAYTRALAAPGQP